MDDIKHMTAKLPYYSYLSEKEIDKINESAAIKHYKKGEQIHTCSKDCLGQITIISGIIHIYLLSEEGREITLFRLFAGDTCFMGASCVISQITFDTFMVAEDDCDVMIVSSSVISKLKEENIHVRCYIYERLTDRFSSVMWTMQQILFNGYDKRLASFLISEYERTKDTKIRMTHEEIASVTSSAREVVARMLRRFSEDGLVEYKRGLIKLIDINGLKELM